MRDRDSFLHIEHLKTDLARRSVQGGAYTIASQASFYALRILSTAVLARLLEPADFGLVAMVTVLTSFSGLFSDMGLSMATVQSEQINHRQVSTLFWINLAISLFLCALTCALAPIIVWFYDEPRLFWITVVIGSSYILSGLIIQHQAILRRQMRFGALGVVTVMSFFISFIVATIAAYFGLGYWSIVILIWGQALAKVVIIWSLCPWIPGRPERRVGTRPLLKFGGFLTGFNLVNYLSRNFDKIVIGRIVGEAALGLYSKAYELLLFPIHAINGPISAVAVPALSRLQNDTERYRRYYQQGIQLIVFFSMPLTVWLMVSAPDIVLLVLGEKWMGSAIIFRLLGPAAFIGTFNVATGWVYVSSGQTRRQFQWGSIAAMIMIGSMLVGSRWGVNGVAASISIATCLSRFPGILYCFHKSHLKFVDLWDVLKRPAGLSILSGMITFYLETAWSSPSFVTYSLIRQALVFGTLYFLGWLILPDGFKTMSFISNRIQSDLLKRSPSSQKQKGEESA